MLFDHAIPSLNLIEALTYAGSALAVERSLSSTSRRKPLALDASLDFSTSDPTSFSLLQRYITGLVLNSRSLLSNVVAHNQ
jgi:hypothetical protein